ncbi:MAG TPA: MFS transporter [Steroidobacteraceae bacterium]|nr:MFS transporter [Steroidobacteraceae bacterium]
MKASAPVESDFSPRKIAIASACLLGSTFVPYVQATISPLMMLPMIREFGWGRTDYALASTFFFIFGSVTVLVFGRVADRVGVRPVLLTGAIFGGVVMVLLSFQTASLWRLYATYALLGGFGSSGVGYAKVIGALFTRHRGKALAIFGAESTVALAALPVLTNTFITHFGWRGTYVAFGLISFLVVPLIYFVIQEPGATPSAASGAVGSVVSRKPAMRRPVPMEGMAAAQIRRDRTFWLIVLLAVLSGGLNQGLITHVVAAMTDKGFSATIAAEVLSISTLVGIIGTLAGGVAVDYFRTAKPMALFALLGASGAFLFAFVKTSFGGLPLLIAAMGVLGAANAAIRPIATYLQTRFFGLRAFAEANAVQIIFQGVAMAITPPLFGMIYDRQGSYALVYWILVGGGILGALIYLALGPYRYAADIGVYEDAAGALMGTSGPS